MAPMDFTPATDAAPTFPAYDPLDPIVRADPDPYYRYLRLHEPVECVPSLNA